MTDMPQRRKEDKFPAKVGRFFYRFFFMIGIAAVISVVMFSVTLSRMMNYVPSDMPDKMVLALVIKSDLAEVVGRPSLTQPLLRPATTLQDIVGALDLAATDKRVKALVVKLEDMKLSAAQVQELREAVIRFRNAGKRAYVFADSYGGYGGGMGDYYLASSFDEIWLQPVGMVAVSGVTAEVPFVRDFLDKVGVETQFTHQGIYKSAPESLTERGMTPPHREMMQSIVSDVTAQLVEGISAGRGMDASVVRTVIDASPYGEKEALARKLVDHVGYFDEMILKARRIGSGLPAEAAVNDTQAKGDEHQAAANEVDAEAMAVAETADASPPENGVVAPAPDAAAAADAGPEAGSTAKEDQDKDEELSAGLVALLGYSFVSETQATDKGVRGFIANFVRKEMPKSELKKKDKVALIYGTGEIVPFTSGAHAAFGESSMGADKIVQAFRSAQKDDSVAAIVFRVDSPGGSPEASETIRRVIMDTQKKGKPVVVSMSSYAASGGYWISTTADKIVAQPGTLTGSIGVFGGKFVFSGLWEKLGLNWDSVHEGKNAQMWSSNISFTPEQMQKFESLMGETYDAFLDRVSEGRKIPRDKVKALAEGRVYTGRQAKEIGLVDDLGGLDVAFKHARELAKFKPEDNVPLVLFPPRKSTLELFISLATEGAASAPRLNISMQDIAMAAEEAARREGAALRAPAFNLR